MGFAVGGETVGGVGFGIDLHAGRAVGVEGAAEAAVPVCLQAVMMKNGFDAQAGFDVGDFHATAL